VTVAHLVCENSIEHQILHLLGHKQALADGVLDGQGDLGALKMPSGRAAMIERLQAMMNAEAVAAPRILSPEEMVVDDLRRRHGERLLLVEAHSGGDGRTRLLAVIDVDGEALAAEAKRHEGQRELGLSVEVIDRSTWLAMQRLAARGMIAMLEPQCRLLHQAPDFAAAAAPAFDPQARAAELRNEAERSLRMARVLAGGGFPEEALPLAAKAIGIGGAARLAALGELAAGASSATTEQIRDLTRRGILPPRVEAALSELWSRAGAGRSPGALAPLIEDAALAIPAADSEIAKAA
jgi:hypothetical protein